MKTILVTAYAVNPYKGSEEGTGWNLICQIARQNNVIAVTRKNNRNDIEKYINENGDIQALASRITFMYYDWNKALLFWKKGPLLSALYFYMWQLTVAIWLKLKGVKFDIAHSLNFHSNWTPTFLWLLGKPYVWGPVGHHPLIPSQYIKPVYGKRAWIKDNMLWAVKWAFWNLDPFHYLSRKKAAKVFCVNSEAGKKLGLTDNKAIFMPAVASEVPATGAIKSTNEFTVLSVGRFVPLKGFDLTIRAFAAFYKTQTVEVQKLSKLLIIGTGPEKKLLQDIVKSEALEHAIEIKEWMPREEVIQRFKTASVFLFPSHEGAGMVVAEALSYGMPVVCLDNIGPGEYVHPQTTLRVKHAGYNETVSALAKKLSVLATNTEVYKIESALALEQFKLQFCWNTKGSIIQKQYDAVIKNLTPIANAA